MNNEAIIGINKEIGNIILEDKYEYSAYMTIGLLKSRDFYIRLEFIGLNAESIIDVAQLGKLDKELKISSIVISKENYDITHIVVEKIHLEAGPNQYAVTWECLSDKPGMPLIIS
jgi:hypothetical protein